MTMNQRAMATAAFGHASHDVSLSHNQEIPLSLAHTRAPTFRLPQTVRDAQVDCALAELYHRGVALERRVGALAQQEAMHAVYARLGELEDQLGWVQHGAAKAAELKHGQEQLRMTDLTYIRWGWGWGQGRVQARGGCSELFVFPPTCPMLSQQQHIHLTHPFAGCMQGQGGHGAAPR